MFALYPDGHNTVYDFCIQLWTRGGELMVADGNFCLDSQQAMEALAFLRDMVNDRSAVHPGCRVMDSVKSGMAFAAGEVAIMVNWFGFAAMADCMPNSEVRGKVSIAPIPHAPGSNGNSLNIFAQSRNPSWRGCCKDRKSLTLPGNDAYRGKDEGGDHWPWRVTLC